MLRYILPLLILLGSKSWAIEVEPLFELHSLSYSEASAVYQMMEDRWKGAPSSDGKVAFTRNRFNSGLRIEWISLAYHQRKDLRLEFSPDTALLAYYKKRKLPVPEGQHYDLKLKARQLSADGVRLGLHLPAWKNIEITGYLYALRGREIQQGQIYGDFAEKHGEQTVDGYFGIGDIHYIYHKDKLLSHQIGRPKGEGYALDLHFSWQYQAYRVKGFIEDALFSMQWRDAGFTDGELSSDNKSFSSEGYVRYSALLKGRRGYKDISQKNISTYSSLDFAYQRDSLSFMAGVRHYANILFPSLGISWQPKLSDHYISLHYEFRSNKTSIGYFWQPKNTGKIGFQFGSDKGNLRYAKALELSLVANYTF